MFQRWVAWLLWGASWFGFGGLHRFYLGRPVSGVLYLLTYNLAGIGLIIDAFSLNDMVDATNARNQLGPGHRGALPPHAAARDQFMRALLRAAQQHGGSITVTQGVLASGRSFAEVEAMLEDMLKSKYVTIDNHPVTGAVVYRFLELEG